DTHIAIGNMATVFAQMHGNAVGAGLFGNESRLNDIDRVQLRTSEHRSMYSYVRLSIDRCTATYV
ncbi:hypothetical protein C7D74_31375, partial [Klebsiella pneumoniae]